MQPPPASDIKTMTLFLEGTYLIIHFCYGPVSWIIISSVGMLMYELHMPIIMMTQLKLQSGLLSKDEAKREFQLALKYLKDSMDILRHQPDGCFEKNVYYGAKDSIQPIQNFVDSQ